jgi:eukaryotic-like serine/threonine-protein kinase
VLGSSLLHYRILERLGAGGMGEVYAAEDTRLNRRVALKILPPELAADPDRLQRFRREAQAIAALSHPNVVTVHSVEEAEGIHFLTMEIVDGRTLSEVIHAGGLAWGDFFRWAIALADAVSAAHQHGVIHRDLKPTNIMIGSGGRLKVLDFGIAKVINEHNALAARTLATTAQMTSAHAIIGTAAYMSPEQAEGKSVDARSDVFALGVVLYEMATSKRPFKGETELGLLSSIIKDNPAPVSQARSDAPADLDRILRKCLAKDLDRRYQTALDVRNDLEDLQQQVNPGRTMGVMPAIGLRRGLAIVTAAVLVVVAIAYFGVSRLAEQSISREPLRTSFNQLTNSPGIEWYPSLSPDGRWVVYAGDASGNRDIYLQSVGGQTPINLTQDSPADDDHPAFSPDGERIVFRSAREGGGLFVMGRTGEAVRRLTRGGFNPAWSPDGRQIAYTTFPQELRPQNTEGLSELWIVGADGSNVRRLVAHDVSLPSWSPNGSRIAFRLRLSLSDQRGGLVSVPVAGGEPTPLVKDGNLDWNPVWTHDGRYVYFISDRGGSTNIWRVRVDESSGRPLSEPEPITSPAPFAAFLSVSVDGRRLAYSSILETQTIQRLSIDLASGAAAAAPSAVTMGTRFWANPDPSPDGQFVVAYSQVNPEGDLYIFRTDGSGASRQLTSDTAVDRVPRWSPDGAWISAFSNRSGSLQIWKIRPDGSDLQRVTQVPQAGVHAWAPDSRRVAATGSLAADGSRSTGAGVPLLFDATRTAEQAPERLPDAPPPDPRFVPNSWSADGRWIAGQTWYGIPGIKVYSVDKKTYQQVIDIGEWPVWLPDSRRILFVSRGREFSIVDVASKQVKPIYSVLRPTLGPPRLTRDGRAAYYSHRLTESDIWLVNLQ